MTSQLDRTGRMNRHALLREDDAHRLALRGGELRAESDPPDGPALDLCLAAVWHSLRDARQLLFLADSQRHAEARVVRFEANTGGCGRGEPIEATVLRLRARLRRVVPAPPGLMRALLWSCHSRECARYRLPARSRSLLWSTRRWRAPFRSRRTASAVISVEVVHTARRLGGARSTPRRRAAAATTRCAGAVRAPIRAMRPPPR